MATVNANPMAATATPAEAKTKKRREKKSWNVTLTSSDGRVARVTATRKGDGSARTFVLHSVPGPGKKRTNSKGATEVHADIESAKARQEQLVDLLVKKGGWVVKEATPRGFQAKPDAFDINSLPAAATGKKSKK